MSMYEAAAVSTSRAILTMAHPLPESKIRTEWENAVKSFSPSKSQKSMEKPCPRQVFLYLYENGYIRGIPKCSATFHITPKNANYAQKARDELIASRPPAPYTSKSALWTRIGATETYNCQIDVVVGLYNAGLLI